MIRLKVKGLGCIRLKVQVHLGSEQGANNSFTNFTKTDLQNIKIIVFYKVNKLCFFDHQLFQL